MATSRTIKTFIPKHGERYRNRERISTAWSNKRVCKRMVSMQMQWPGEGLTYCCKRGLGAKREVPPLVPEISTTSASG